MIKHHLLHFSLYLQINEILEKNLGISLIIFFKHQSCISPLNFFVKKFLSLSTDITNTILFNLSSTYSFTYLYFMCIWLRWLVAVALSAMNIAPTSNSYYYEELNWYLYAFQWLDDKHNFLHSLQECHRLNLWSKESHTPQCLWLLRYRHTQNIHYTATYTSSCDMISQSHYHCNI